MPEATTEDIDLNGFIVVLMGSSVLYEEANSSQKWLKRQYSLKNKTVNTLNTEVSLYRKE